MLLSVVGVRDRNLRAGTFGCASFGGDERSYGTAASLAQSEDDSSAERRDYSIFSR